MERMAITGFQLLFVLVGKILDQTKDMAAMVS